MKLDFAFIWTAFLQLLNRSADGFGDNGRFRFLRPPDRNSRCCHKAVQGSCPVPYRNILCNLYSRYSYVNAFTAYLFRIADFS